MWLKQPLKALAFLMLLGLALNHSVNAYVQFITLLILMNSLLALGLNLVNGFTGQFSLGHAGFMAVGAYFTAYASMNWSFLTGPSQILEIFIFTSLSGLLAAFFGYIVGLPSLRLKGDYLAIVTLGFGEIIRVSLLNFDALGGARGISGIPPFPEFSFGDFTLDRFLTSYFICIVWVIVGFVALWRIKYSQHGLAFLSIREDEMAAESMGIATTKIKVKAFVISSFLAGVAGGLFSYLTNIVTPNSFTFAEKSVSAVMMVVLGGMGSLSGSVLAAAFVTVLPELLRAQPELRMILFSLILILVMIFRPQGLMGEKELPEVISKFWRKYVQRPS